MTRIIDPPPPSSTSDARRFRWYLVARLIAVLVRGRGYISAAVLAVPLIVLDYDLVGIAAFLTAVSAATAHRAGALGGLGVHR
jgi:hypothetical protein